MKPKRLFTILAAGVAGLSGVAVGAEPSPLPAGAALTGVTVEPAALTLLDARDTVGVLVTGRTADGSVYDLTRSATYRFEHSGLAEVTSDGVVRPLSPGKTVMHVTVPGKTLNVPVNVGDRHMALSSSVGYTHEVQPVISKGGCNAGACHGYSLGKNGFRLSLRGAEHALDHKTITREEGGRRINIPDPDASLLLRKASGGTPHEGGIRLDSDSVHYRILRQWIAEGAKDDSATAPKLLEVRVVPEYRVIPRPGLQQQLQVLARYSDGRVRDVTRDAIYTAGADDVASVGEDGLVTSKVRGESPITIRYERVVLVSRITVMSTPAGYKWSDPPAANYVDTHIFNKLRDMRIVPSDPTTDAEVLRRAYLDTIGVIPTAAEVRAFLADAKPDKRARMIDHLLGRPEFVSHWSLKWADLLQNSRDFLTEQEVWRMRMWIREAVGSNRPFDQFARELLTGDGSAVENPPAAFYRVSKDPIIAAERAVQVFCGIRMLCARCHNHPFENWTQEDYYGLASFFSQVTAKKDLRDAKREVIVLNPAGALSVNKRSGKPQAPRFLGGKEPTISAGEDRRAVFAAWLTDAKNPFFARATVNRVWSYFFGRGIIEPVDDIRISNPAVNEPLLAALAEDFVAHKFDLKHLMRTILNSRTYQLSGRTNDFNRDDGVNFSHGVPRRMSAEQFLDSVGAATGVPEAFPGVPSGFKAQELPDPQVASYVLDIFGRPARKEACECERGNDTNMIQALHMINGKTLTAKLGGGNVARLTGAKLTDREVAEELYLLTMGRPPADNETALVERYLKVAKTRAEGVADLMWALLNSREFLFNN